MGIKITIREQEVDLQETPNEVLEELLDDLTEAEEESVQQQIMQAMGVNSPEELADIMDEMEENLENNAKKEEVDNQVSQQPILPPILLEVSEFNHDLLLEGVDKATIAVGEYTALINAGMTSKQAFDFMMDSRSRQHELTILDKQLEQQLKVKTMEAQTQLQINGLKHLLSEN